MNGVVVGSQTAIRIDNVEKRYGPDPAGVLALKGVSLDIADNEFFTLLGPSGCGKTTLLRVLAGFESVTRGQVMVFGENVAGLPANKRPINTVFQHYALFPHMTVAENVAYGMRRLRWADDKITETMKRSLTLVKMENFASRLPTQLSGGQQQRVALARALAPHPKVLLLDEPLSALDLKLRQAMRVELKQLQKATGITFVFVTHDQEEALSMSDRIAVMSEGFVQQVGTPTEIYEHPANKFVASFIGDANFLDVKITKITAASAACRTERGLEFNFHPLPSHRNGDQVTLFLRPEKAVVAPKTSKGIKGKISFIDYLGQSTYYYIDIGERDLFKVEARNSDDGKFPHKAGDEVVVNFGASAIRVLES